MSGLQSEVRSHRHDNLRSEQESASTPLGLRLGVTARRDSAICRSAWRTGHPHCLFSRGDERIRFGEKIRIRHVNNESSDAPPY